MKLQIIQPPFSYLSKKLCNIIMLLFLSYSGFSQFKITQIEGETTDTEGVAVIDETTAWHGFKVLPKSDFRVLYDKQQLSIVGNIITLENGGQVDLSSVGTDDQNITAVLNSNNTLAIGIEDGNQTTVDLSALGNYWTKTGTSLSTNGNVGVGTTAPTEKLQVNGNLKIFGNSKKLIFTAASDPAYTSAIENNYSSTNKFNLFVGSTPVLSHRYFGANTTAIAGNAITFHNSSPSSSNILASFTNGVFTIRNGGTSSAPKCNLALGYNGTENYKQGIFTGHNSGNSFGNTISFKTHKTEDGTIGLPSNTQLTLGSTTISNLATFTGQVIGLDATSPNAFVTKQQVEAGLGNYWTKTGTELSYAGDTEVLGTLKSTVPADNSKWNFKAYNSNDLTKYWSMYIHSGGNINFAREGTTYSYVNSAGNVTFIKPVRGVPATNSNEYVTKSQLDGLGSLWTKSGTSISYDAAGYVGIGTNTPSEKLEVNGNIRLSGSLYSGTKEALRLTDNWLRINPSTDFSTGIYTGTSLLRHDGEFQIYAGGSRMIVKENGNVGIGTATPTNLLHIKKNGATLRLSSVSTNLELSSRIQFEEGSSGKGIEFFYDGRNVGASNGSLRFRDIGTGLDLMTFMRSGNVGIGLVNPTQKLDVAGGARFSSMVMAQSFFAPTAYIYDFYNIKSMQFNGSTPATVPNRTIFMSGGGSVPDRPAYKSNTSVDFIAMEEQLKTSFEDLTAAGWGSPSFNTVIEINTSSTLATDNAPLGATRIIKNVGSSSVTFQHTNIFTSDGGCDANAPCVIAAGGTVKLVKKTSSGYWIRID